MYTGKKKMGRPKQFTDEELKQRIRDRASQARKKKMEKVKEWEDSVDEAQKQLVILLSQNVYSDDILEDIKKLYLKVK